MPPFKIDSNLSEKQIEADVAAYLGWCSKSLPFRLLDINEQETGADKLYDVTMPIYIQFKKSLGLRALGMVPRTPGHDGPLQRIRHFRARHRLADNPTLCFQLREKSPSAPDYQHNVLFAHNQPQRSYAIYVAPLILDRDSYYRDLCEAPRYLDSPWSWREANLLNSWGPNPWLSRYDLQPFLRKHVSIAPHQRVDTHKHHYAYSEAGDDVSWHSPTLIEGGPFRLSDFMTQRVRELLLGDEALPSPDDALSVASEALSSLDLSPEDILSGENSFERLRSYGRWLHKTFEIRQILLCASSKQLWNAQRIVARSQ